MADSDWTDVPTSSNSDWVDAPAPAQPSTASTAAPTPDKDGWADAPTAPAEDRSFVDRFKDAYAGASQQGLEGIIARHALTLAGNDPAAVAQAQEALRGEYAAKADADPWWNKNGGVVSNLLERGVPTLLGNIAGNPENLIGGGGEGLVAKMGRQGLLSGGIDVGSQFADMADNVQKDFDASRAATAAAMGSGFAGLHELGSQLFSAAKARFAGPTVDAAPTVETSPHGQAGPDVLDDGTVGVRGATMSPDDFRQGVVDLMSAKDDKGNYINGADEIRKYAAANGADPDGFKNLDAAIAARNAGQNYGVNTPGADNTAPASPTVAPDPVVAANDAHEAAKAAFDEEYQKGKDLKPGTTEYKKWVDNLQPLSDDAAKTYTNLTEAHDAIHAGWEDVPETPQLTDARSQQAALKDAYPEETQATVPDDTVNSALMHWVKPGEPGITIEDRAPNSPTKAVIFRDENGEPKGIAQFRPGESVSTYVDPEFRRQGIASQMYDHAKANGYDLDAIGADGDHTEAGAAFSNRGLVKAIKDEGSSPDKQTDIPDNPHLPALSGNGAGGKPPVDGTDVGPVGDEPAANNPGNNDGTENPTPGGKRKFNKENFDYEKDNTASEDEVRGAFDHFEKTLGKGFMSHETNAENAKTILKNNPMVDIIRHEPTTSEAANGWITAKRVAALAAGNRALEAAKKYTVDPTDENWTELNHWRVVAGAGVESVSRESEHLGRALNSFRIMAGNKGMAEAYRSLDEMMHGRAPVDRGHLARLMIEHQNNPEAAGDIALNSTKPYWEDYAMKMWYNFALSSPKTAVTTALDNTQALVTDLAEHTFAPGVSRAETAARWAGLHQGIMDVLNYKSGWDMMKDTLAADGRRGPIADQSQASKDIQTAYDKAHPVTGAATHAPMGVDLGPLEFTSIGPKRISAVDQTYRGIAATMEHYGLAVRQAEKLGYKSGTPEFAQKVADLRVNPPKWMVEKINQKARSSQYAEDLPQIFGGVLQKMTQRQVNMTPMDRAGRFLAFLAAPFPRVEGNIMRRIIRSSPFGVLSNVNRKMWQEGGQSRSIVMTRMALGTTAMGMMASLADQSLPVHITGNGPDDYRMRQNMPPGWQPNSLHYNGHYYPLGNTLWATTAGTVASAKAAFDEGRDSATTYGQKLSSALSGMVGAIENNTWFKDGADFFDMFKPGREGDLARNRFIPNKVASFVVPAVVSAVNQSEIDNKVHDLKAPTLGARVVKTIESRIPGVSKDLPQQTDVYGNPLTRSREFFTGTNVTSDGTNPVQNEMSRLAEATGKPVVSAVRTKVTFRNKPVELTGQQAQDFQSRAGQHTEEMFTHFMNSPMYQRMTDAQRATVLKSMGSSAKQRALIETLGVK